MMTTKRALILLGRILLSTVFILLLLFGFMYDNSVGGNQDLISQFFEHFVGITVVFFIMFLAFYAANEWMRIKNKTHTPLPYFLIVVTIPLLTINIAGPIYHYIEREVFYFPSLRAFFSDIYIYVGIPLFFGLIHYIKYNYKSKNINKKIVNWKTKVILKKVVVYALVLSLIFVAGMIYNLLAYGYSVYGIIGYYIESFAIAIVCWYLMLIFNKHFENKTSFLGLLAASIMGVLVLMQFIVQVFDLILNLTLHGSAITIKYFNFNFNFNFVEQILSDPSRNGYIILCVLFYQFLYLNQTRSTEQKAFKAAIGKQIEKYESLRRQLSPHFLFNNLNVLTALIEENPQKAVRFSESLGNIYRHFLRQEDEDVVSLQSALSFSKDYLELLKYRYEEAFQYVLPATVTSNQYIIPLALQQVIENTIKHNEVSKEKPLQITIGIQDDYIIIQNTKQLKVAIEKAKRTGIENIQKRYAFLTEKEVVIEDEVNSFTIKLPLLNMENA